MYGPGYPLINLLSPVLIAFIIFDVIIRGVALWRTARSEQKGWFIALLILNSLGILPVIYLLFFQKKARKK